MRKQFWLLLAISLLALLFMQSYFDFECMEVGAEGAELKVQGVICWYQLDGFRRFITLEELRFRHDNQLRMNECIKNHPNHEYLCDKQYKPPISTPDVGIG